MSVVVDEGGGCSTTTDSEGRTRESASEASFQLGYRQHPGRGSGILEEEICLLDSGAASRGEGGSEGTLGRGHGGEGLGEVGRGEEGQWRVSMIPFDVSLFYPDLKGMDIQEIYAREYLETREHDYDRGYDEVLGISQFVEHDAYSPEAEQCVHLLTQEMVEDSQFVFSGGASTAAPKVMPFDPAQNRATTSSLHYPEPCTNFTVTWKVARALQSPNGFIWWKNGEFNVRVGLTTSLLGK